MASQPAKQLSSKKIRSALISQVLPATKGSSLITAKVSLSANGDCDQRNANWLDVCTKRDDCDEALKKIPGMSFFFSSISTIERKRKPIQRLEGTTDECVDEQIQESEVFHPAITYWMAINSQNGSRVSTIPIHAAFLEVGVEAEPKCIQSWIAGKENALAGPLCTIVKDHKNAFLQSKVDNSFMHHLNILSDQMIDEPMASPHGSERVVRLQVVSPHIKAVLRTKVVPTLTRAGLVFDVFGIEVTEDQQVSKSDKTRDLASPLVIALNDIERAMERLHYAIYRGDVFRKVPTAIYTYQHCCSVKKFLSILASNPSLKEAIIKHMAKLESLLADPDNELVKQLKINFDLIEVNDGWCFSLKQRKFVKYRQEDEAELLSPRAFVPYDRFKTPEPGFFKEILTNSLDETEIGHFCEYYVRLLNHKGKQHKEKVLCLVGEPNSGKTSLFTPITAIVPTRYIAMISKQKAFNKSMINEDTQVIFLDEAYAKLMDTDDWKNITQGGLMAHDKKYRSAAPMEIHSPVFITSQTRMEFGQDHQDAMEVRLRTFEFKKLQGDVRPGVQEFLIEHAMDCIVWASQQAVKPDDELPLRLEEDRRPPQQVMMDKEEKERIRCLNIDSEGELDEHIENTEQNSDEESHDSEADASEDDMSTQSQLQKICALRDRQPKQGLKQRQLDILTSEVQRISSECQKELEQMDVNFFEKTKSRWIEVGMIDKDDAHLVTSLQEPFHPVIEQSRRRYFARKKEEELKTLQKKALEYYKNRWILAREEDLRELQRNEDMCSDHDVKMSIHYRIQVIVDALRAHYQKQEEEGLMIYILAQRRKMALKKKWLSRCQLQEVKSIWDPLPFPGDSADSENDEESIQSQELFSTCQTNTQSSSQPTRKRKTSTSKQKSSTQVPKRGRITHFFSQVPK